MASLDVGALKLQFNNEILKVKKYIVQAKTQTIHKLTRNVQKLKNRKGTEEELAKFKIKADSLVQEIMFIKKIHHNDLGRFALKNFDNLNKIMDTPVVTEEKAMAKLLSHKSLKSRFQNIVNQFSIVSADTLLEVNPNKIRRKENKEKAKRMMLENANNPNNVKDVKKSYKQQREELTETANENEDPNNSESDEIQQLASPNVQSSQENEHSDLEQNFNNILKSEEDEDSHDSDSDVDGDSESVANSRSFTKKSDSDDDYSSVDECDEKSNLDKEDIPTLQSKSSKKIKQHEKSSSPLHNPISKSIERDEQSLSNKDEGKEKVGLYKKPKRMYVDWDDNEVKSLTTEKTVDSFFVTDSGDNYLTLALPRKPDSKPCDPEESSVNRKMRRAALFGNEVRPRKVNKSMDMSQGKGFDRFQKYDHDKDFQPRGDHKRKQFEESKHTNDNLKLNKPAEDEKLHPSWEAKKKKSALVAFQGKKVVFDE